MNVADALTSRYTCRAFKPEPLRREVLAGIFEAALHAPSWANTQPWEIYVAGGETLAALRQACLDNFHNGVEAHADLPRPEQWPAVFQKRMQSLGAARFKSLGMDRADEASRQKMSENNNRFFGAPAVAWLCMDKTLSQWSIHDLGMMAQSIMLAAQERGVASAIAYNLVIYPDLIRPALEIPDDLAVIIGIALGYADTGSVQNSFRSPRRPLDEVVRFRGVQAALTKSAYADILFS
ncbi:MAG: nitroreductase [Thermoleophilia bacterium]